MNEDKLKQIEIIMSNWDNRCKEYWEDEDLSQIDYETLLEIKRVLGGFGVDMNGS